MENIFENAKFGDRFMTRDGRMAIFLAHNEYNSDTSFFITSDWDRNAIDRSPSLLTYDGHFSKKEDGDIVSEWDDPIDEEKLDKLLSEYCSTIPNEDYSHNKAERFFYINGIKKGFKTGYRAAKNE